MFRTYISTKFILGLFIVVSALSCVPKATEKKAICAANETFDNVTRTCYQSVANPGAPEGILTGPLSFDAQVAKKIKLTYSDINNDLAMSCKVDVTNTHIEAISPNVTDGSFKVALAEIYASTFNVSTSLNGANFYTAQTAVNELNTLINRLSYTFNYDLIISNLSLIKVRVGLVQTLAQAEPSNIDAQAFLAALTQKMTQHGHILDSITNRCVCSGGECFTSIIPQKEKSGTSGFIYRVTDKDGVSLPRTVAVAIAPLNPALPYLEPVGTSTFVQFNEEDTNKITAQTYAVTVGTGVDFYATSVNSFRYTFNGSTTCTAGGCTGITSNNGRVYGCLNLIGSTGTNDRSCVYTPPTNDGSGVTHAIANLVVDGISFSAKSNGTYGNNVKIKYIDVKSVNAVDSDPFATSTQLFGLVDRLNGEGYIKVEGDVIKIFFNEGFTTRNNIMTLINNHQKAKNLVDIALLGVGTDPVDYNVLNVAEHSLVNGLTGYDSFNITVNNLISSSTNTASVTISMLAQNDPPQVPVEYSGVYSNPITLYEDGASVVHPIDFRDVDSTTNFTLESRVANGLCATNVTTSEFNTMGSNPYFSFPAYIGGQTAAQTIAVTQTGVTFQAGIELSAISDFNGSACLYYRVTDNDGKVSGIQNISITVNPVNDAPKLGVSSFTELAAPHVIADVYEDLVNASVSFQDLYAQAGGTGGFENNQFLNYEITYTGDVFTNQKCVNYQVVSGSPIGAVTPTTIGALYLDTTNWMCYRANGLTNADFELYPSLTILPECNYSAAKVGTGTPQANSRVPSSIGDLYLDKATNKCYVATGATSASWAEGNSTLVSSTKTFKSRFMYIPNKDKSGMSNFTIKVTDACLAGASCLDGVVSGITHVNHKSFDFSLNTISVNDPVYFRQAVALVESNEGGTVLAGPFYLDEDEGATADEDLQGVSILSIESDNDAVIPESNISIFYDLNLNGVQDDGEVRTLSQVLEAADGDNVAMHPFYLKLRPITGVVGNANIKITAIDNGALAIATAKTFSFVVHPIAAIHGGWANISSVGLKTNKLNNPLEVIVNGSNETTMISDIKCNYNKAGDTSSCSGLNCVGTQAPHSIINADAANVLFWDNSNQKCYRSTAVGVSSWVEHNSSCPISRNANFCGGQNCIANYSSNPTTKTPDFIGEYIYDTSSKSCYVAQDITNSSWIKFVPSKVTLAWNNFTIVGSGANYSSVSIAGWNVYRREEGRDYDFSKNGHLRNESSSDTFTISGVNNRSFIDNTAIAGKVYYYIVRPVDSKRFYPTHTAEDFSEIRVVAAPENYAFVHRWMINQEICQGMNLTTNSANTNFIDRSHNYRCNYFGPGRTVVGADSFYDYGSDLLVDLQEAGCSYAQAPKCGSDGCVGTAAPVSTLNVVTNDLYYNRSNGTCYAYNGGWQEYDAVATPAVIANVAKKISSALNPPLAMISKDQAKLTCAARPGPVLLDMDLSGVSAKLPNKKDFMAYSAHKLSQDDEAISAMERGQSMNSISVCNGLNADGLSGNFTNSEIPSTSLMYTIAGTQSSNIRSLHTGSIPWATSFSTKACTSRFGVQDLYGNVSEWIDERFECFETVASVDVYTCLAAADASYAGSSFKDTDFSSIAGSEWTYGLDGVVGPHLSTAFLTRFTYEDTGFYTGLGYFSYPLGMPIHENIKTFDEANPIDLTKNFEESFPWLLTVGHSTGISFAKLHEDGMIVNGSDGIKDVSVGGSYVSDSYSGRYTMEFSAEDAKRVDTGFRCILPIDNSEYTLDTFHTYPY